MKLRSLVMFSLCAALLVVLPGNATAQDSKFTVNGYVQMQGGVFVPLTSQLFKDYDNRAYLMIQDEIDTSRPCDPVNNPNVPCHPVEHGAKAGKASIMRGTVQLMAEYRPEDYLMVRAVVRLVGSLFVA